jgi:hypothetical protein
MVITEEQKNEIDKQGENLIAAAAALGVRWLANELPKEMEENYQTILSLAKIWLDEEEKQAADYWVKYKIIEKGGTAIRELNEIFVKMEKEGKF